MKWLLTLLLFPVACHAQDIIYGQHSFTGPLILINTKNNSTADSCLATDSNGVVHNKLVTSGWGLTGNTGASAAVNFIGTRDNNGLSLATHDTTRLHIDSLGHVGIGVVPVNKLDLLGTSRLKYISDGTESFSVYSGDTLILDGTTAIPGSGIENTNYTGIGILNANAFGTYGGLLFFGNILENKIMTFDTVNGLEFLNGSNQFTLDTASGTPGQVLTYSGSGVGMASWQDAPVSFDTAHAWNISGNSGTSPVASFIGTTDDNGFSLRTNDTTRIHIDSLGRVGIGVLPETYNGRVPFTTSLGGFTKIDTAVGIGGQNNDLLIAEYRYGFASVRTATGSPLILQAIYQGNGGSVGIGTSTPQATLDITGTTHDIITTPIGDTVQFLLDSSLFGSGLRGEAFQVQRPDGSLTHRFDVSNIGLPGYSPYGVSGPGWAEQSIGVNTAHYSLMICDTERLVIAFNGLTPGFATFTPTGLGIGTFTPQKNLDVQGSFNLSTNGNISGVASINYLPEGTTPAIYYKDTAHGSLAAINTAYVFSNGTPIASMSINDTLGNNFSQANLYMDEYDVFLSDTNANPTLAWQMDGDDTTIVTNASVTFQDQLNPVTTTWLSPSGNYGGSITAYDSFDSTVALNSIGIIKINAPLKLSTGAEAGYVYISSGGAASDAWGPLPLTSLTGTSSVPSIAAGSGAGTSPTVNISGTNIGGIITVTPGSSASAGASIVTVTYNSLTFPNDSYITITPANAATALLNGATMVYVNGGTNTFTITSGTTALTTSTTYSWNYTVTGN